MIKLSLRLITSFFKRNLSITLFIFYPSLIYHSFVFFIAPYVRATLLINNRTVKTKKTTYKKYTLDPVFNESLSFDINSVQLQEANIVMTVLDFNGGVVKDTLIGRIVLGKESSGKYK